MPTAELAQDQYDIDTLPQYDVLDNILKSFKKYLSQIGVVEAPMICNKRIIAKTMTVHF